MDSVQQTAKYDIVIPYRTHSNFSEEELRYALRSIAKNFLPLGDVYIIGDCPNWVKGVIYIPTNQGYSKADNVRGAYHLAVALPDLSEDFVIWHDDTYLLEPIDEIPLWHGDSLQEFLAKYQSRYPLSYYTAIIERTTQRLPIELPNWELHTPYKVNKRAFAEQLKTYAGQGALSRTLYYNLFHQGEGEYHQDVKLYEVSGSLGWQNEQRFKTFASSDDKTFFQVFYPVLKEMFPEPCKFEDSV